MMVEHKPEIAEQVKQARTEAETAVAADAYAKDGKKGKEASIHFLHLITVLKLVGTVAFSLLVLFFVGASCMYMYHMASTAVEIANKGAQAVSYVIMLMTVHRVAAHLAPASVA